MALLTSTEAAKYLGYSEYSLRKSRCDGNTLCGHPTPDFIRIGTKTIRYKQESLDAWIGTLSAVSGGANECIISNSI